MCVDLQNAKESRTARDRSGSFFDFERSIFMSDTLPHDDTAGWELVCGVDYSNYICRTYRMPVPGGWL
jgi:hypothetical protein